MPSNQKAPETICEAAVLGLGGVGSAAFAELARRGVDVLGIDRWQPPHSLGSSHGQSRIFRVAYFEHPDYVPLAQRSRDLWVKLDEDADERIFVPSGGAWFGPEECRVIRDSRLAADQHGLEYEYISGAEANTRWPAFSADSNAVCFYEKDAGIVCPEHAIANFIKIGVAHGGTLRCNEEVLRIDPEHSHVRIQLEREVIRAQRVIVTLGAWTGSLLPDAGVTLNPRRQLLGWTKPKHHDVVQEGQMPVWVFSDSDTSIQYGFPICNGLPGPSGCKIARHNEGDPCDPNTVRREINSSDQDALIKDLITRVPAAAGELLEARVCLYTMSEDEHFIVDRHPSYERITIGCGFSGHGFKFCPVLGEGLADLMLDGETPLPLGFLSCNRFDQMR